MSNAFKNMFAALPRAFLLGVGTFAVVLMIIFVSKRFYEDTENNPVLIKKGADLLKQAAEWTFSSQQAENPLLALTHANYAMAYLNLARNLASDRDLTDFTKIPVNDLREDTEAAVKKAKDRVLTLCPQAGNKKRTAAYVGYYSSAPSPSRPSSSSSFSYQYTPQQQIRPPVASAVPSRPQFQSGGGGFGSAIASANYQYPTTFRSM